MLFLSSNWNEHIVYVVSLKTLSSNIFNKTIEYFSKNNFLSSISLTLIDDQKFKGMISIPPRQILVINSFDISFLSQCEISVSLD